MCGITGFWSFTEKENSQQAQERLAAMSSAIAHRGPDGQGVWYHAKQGLGFGHRRLAIVDLSEHGKQPMHSHSGQSVLVYNGEIYNAQAIKTQLLKEFNTPFQGHADTEILLEALEHWGIDKTLKSINGMFAFAFWSETTQTLTLARDRVGIKPLYWGLRDGQLFFGSQLKSFKPHPKWHSEIDDQALQAYFQLGYIPAPLCIFKHTQKLQAGHYLTIQSPENIQSCHYWKASDIAQQAILTQSSTEHEETLDNLLTDAVNLRMIADVPVGAFLSGGVDSSTVAALMQKNRSKPISTFSIGFDVPQYNEAPHAKAVASHLNTDHHELMIQSKDAYGLVPTLSEHYDEPFADPSQLPTFLVSKMTQKQVTVALSGDGGDELFAGYTRYTLGNKIWQAKNCLPNWLVKPVAGALTKQCQGLSTSTRLPGSIQPFLQKGLRLSQLLNMENFPEFYLQLVSAWTDPQSILKHSHAPYQWPEHPSSLDTTQTMQWLDLVTYLPENILTKVDRASMATGLEARVPILDHRVVSYAWQIPQNLKQCKGESKWLLKQVLKRYLPDNLIDRPKMGFGIPLAEWLRGPLKDWGYDLLTNHNTEISAIIKHQEALKLWEQHLSGHFQHHRQLWTLLIFIAWHRNWQK